MENKGRELFPSSGVRIPPCQIRINSEVKRRRFESHKKNIVKGTTIARVECFSKSSFLKNFKYNCFDFFWSITYTVTYTISKNQITPTQCQTPKLFKLWVGCHLSPSNCNTTQTSKSATTSQVEQNEQFAE